MFCIINIGENGELFEFQCFEPPCQCNRKWSAVIVQVDGPWWIDVVRSACVGQRIFRTFLPFTRMAKIIKTEFLSTLLTESMSENEAKETKWEEEFWELFPYDTHRVVMKWIGKWKRSYRDPSPGHDMIAYIARCIGPTSKTELIASLRTWYTVIKLQ